MQRRVENPSYSANIHDIYANVSEICKKMIFKMARVLSNLKAYLNKLLTKIAKKNNKTQI